MSQKGLLTAFFYNLLRDFGFVRVYHAIQDIDGTAELLTSKDFIAGGYRGIERGILEAAGGMADRLLERLGEENRSQEDQKEEDTVIACRCGVCGDEVVSDDKAEAWAEAAANSPVDLNRAADDALEEMRSHLEPYNPNAFEDLEKALNAVPFVQRLVARDGGVDIWTGVDSVEGREIFVRVEGKEDHYSVTDGCATKWVHEALPSDVRNAVGDMLEYYHCALSSPVPNTTPKIVVVGMETGTLVRSAGDVADAVQRMTSLQLALGGIWALHTIRKRKG